MAESVDNIQRRQPFRQNHDLPVEIRPMKKLTLIVVTVLISLIAEAKGNDTAYYRRPYYLGVTVGYNGFVNGVFAQHPSIYSAWQNPDSWRVNWNTKYGLMLALPFAKRWELELGLEALYAKGWNSDITGVHYDVENPMKVVGFDYAIFHSHSTSLTTRLQFGYEIFRKNNYALVGGAEMWMDVIGRHEFTRYNQRGYALVLKSYIPVSHANGAIQISVLVGDIASRSMYVGARMGFALKGTRVYRHKPKKYYVQTYED